MNEKQARLLLRSSLRMFRRRIRFPKIRIKLREILASEDLISIGKELAQSWLQRKAER